MSFKNLEGQTAHWIQRLQEYTIKVANTTPPMPFRDDHAKECTHRHKVESQADIKQVQATAAVAAAGWNPVAMRTERSGHRAHSGGSRD
jgi:hypothetical protein